MKPITRRIVTQSAVDCNTQADLARVYTPGVAEPSRQIAKQVESAYTLTNKRNLVAVVTNGTAVLGLGNIGPAAAKPVMEGKAVLFKQFAGVDAFDLEIAENDPDKFIDTVARLEPTFGGINLEDIAAPDCFYIERELQKRMNIPVFHDDQHGTAIISGAALMNAAELVGKPLAKLQVVMSGAGAAGIRCAEHYVRLGVKKSNITMCDSHGIITKDRTGLHVSKKQFAQTVPGTLEDALVGADVFVGVSAPNIVTADMLKTMAPNPIVFAMANPDPEIAYTLAKQSRPDLLFATGRSDYPNQINNVLGFPFVFRGALDTRASVITEGMKLAATLALAKLAHAPIPASVMKAYKIKQLKFGKEYIVPKPFDKRVLVEVSAAVAKAAMEDGVARIKLNISSYKKQLARSL